MSSNRQLLTGKNIYLDRKGQYIYFNKKSNIGYRIPIDQINKYRFLQTRYILALVVYIILSDFFGMPQFLGIFAGIALLAYTSYDYYKKFLPNLTQFHNFVPDPKQGEIALLTNEDTPRLYLKVFLYAIFGILLILNAFVSEASLLIFTGSGIIAVFAWQLSIKHILAIKAK